MCSALHVSEKEVPLRVAQLQKEVSALQTSNALLMRSALISHQPAFVVKSATRQKAGELRVYEVDGTMPEEYVTKLVARLKEDADDMNRLIVHNKNFTLLCGKEMKKEEIELLKNAIFEVYLRGCME